MLRTRTVIYHAECYSVSNEGGKLVGLAVACHYRPSKPKRLKVDKGKLWFEFDPLSDVNIRDVAKGESCFYMRSPGIPYKILKKEGRDIYFCRPNMVSDIRRANLDEEVLYYDSVKIPHDSRKSCPSFAFHRRSDDTLIFVYTTCIIMRKFGQKSNSVVKILDEIYTKVTFARVHFLEREDVCEIVWNVDQKLPVRKFEGIVMRSINEYELSSIYPIGKKAVLKAYGFRDDSRLELCSDLTSPGKVLWTNADDKTIKIYRIVYANDQMVFLQCTSMKDNYFSLRILEAVPFDPKVYCNAKPPIRIKLDTVCIIMRRRGLPRDLVKIILYYLTKTLFF